MNIFEKIKNGNNIENAEFMMSNENPIEIFRAYEERIRELIKEKEKLSLFPYPLNDGGRADFGEFYLISHVWFSFLNTSDLVGIVEIEWKNVKKSRKTYIGIGKGQDVTVDVLNVAHYGQKLKD